jgi:predicted lipoprotein with Yx(FWY)xxD motif
MAILSSARLRAAGIAALATTALLVAGCGGSSSSSSSATPAAPATASSSSSSTATSSSGNSGAQSIGTAKGSSGTYLTGPDGRAIYLWVADKDGKSVCYGACAKAWPPVLAKGKPAAGAGVNAALLGTVARRDGTQQVTYKGWPLYYFIADKSKGQTVGQGSDSFHAKWWLVAPSGQAITSG